MSRRTLQAVLLLVFVGGVVLVCGRIPPPDAAIQLYLAGAVLKGSRLAVDFQEVNPPLFVWLALPVVLLGKLTGASLWRLLVLLAGALSIVSLALSARVLRLSPENGPRRDRTLVLLVFVLVLFPLEAFANREHFALILTVPYVLLAAVRSEGVLPSAGLAVLSGVLAAVGFALKPFFLPAWLVIELYLSARQGRRVWLRPETLAVIGLGALYLAAVALLVPQYFAFALTWGGLYSRYLRNDLFVAAFPDLPTLLLPFALCTYLAWNHRKGAGPLDTTLLLASLGFWLGAVLQRKGFSYHYLPASGYALLLVATVAWGWSGGGFHQPSDLVLRGARGVVLLLVATTLVALAGEAVGVRQVRYLDRAFPRLARLVHREAAGQPILVLSSNPASGWPLTLEAGAEWGSRFMHQWPLAAAYHDELRQDGVARVRPDVKRVGLERLFDDAVVEDLDRYTPSLIVVLQVDTTEPGFGRATHLDYLGYFAADPRFRRVLAKYDTLDRIGGYLILRRKREGPRPREREVP